MQFVFTLNAFVSPVCSDPQLSERMKVVDVLSSKVYSDAQQIIAQVTNHFERLAQKTTFISSAATFFFFNFPLLLHFLF